MKEEDSQESWILFTRYNLATVLYRLHREFRYMITNITLKTEQPQITFYYEDILPYLKKHNSILNLQKNSKTIYKQAIQIEYNKYLLIGQSICNQYLSHSPWNELWKNTFFSYSWPENNNILLHYTTRTKDQIYIDGLTKSI